MADGCKVTILHEGYIREPVPKRYEAGCTLVLIQLETVAVESIEPEIIPQMGQVKNILFEAGGPWEAQSIVNKLKEHNLKCEDIDLLVCRIGWTRLFFWVRPKSHIFC